MVGLDPTIKMIGQKFTWNIACSFFCENQTKETRKPPWPSPQGGAIRFIVMSQPLQKNGLRRFLLASV